MAIRRNSNWSILASLSVLVAVPTVTIDASADPTKRIPVDSEARSGNPIPGASPSTPPGRENTSKTQEPPRWHHDDRFVSRVKAFAQMSDALDEACKAEKSTDVKIRRRDTIDAAVKSYVERTIGEMDAAIRALEVAIAKGDSQKEEYTQTRRKLEADRQRLKDRLKVKKVGPSNLTNPSTSGLGEQIENVLSPPSDVCASFCKGGEDDRGYCRFADTTLATAAMISDPRSVETIARSILKRDELNRALRQNAVIQIESLRIRLANLPEAEVSVTAPWLAVESNARALLEPQKSAMAGGTALALRTMDVALAALARVIEDRAKREGFVWFLKKMHDDVCNANNLKVSAEIREYWLPNTCSLAQTTADFIQYGGGAELLRAFQGAIAGDVKQWPGAAAGLGMATLFLKDASASENVLACHASSTDTCKAAISLRKATAKLTKDIIAGVHVGIALDEYAVSIEALNHGNKFHSNKLQAAACVASIPLVFQQYEQEVSQLNLNRFDAARALLLGTLARSPACFALTAAKPQNPNILETERFETILQWANSVDVAARAVVGRWDVLRDASSAFANAMTDMQSHADDSLPTLPEFNVGAVNDAKSFKEAVGAVQTYTENTVRLVQQSRQFRFAQSSAALAHAGIDFSMALTAGGKNLGTVKLFPGWANIGDQKPFDEAHEMLLKLSEQLDTIDSALVGDWSKMVPQVLAGIRSNMTAACGTGTDCTLFASTFSRYAGIFTALATNSDPNAVARALDAAAMPIGGWQGKRVPGATMYSIASFPGISVGGEFRYGQYGATYEMGKPLHWASPTLTMPVGIDFSWGNPNVKIFVSLVDPAAYLQYDGENQGRLPGAQLTTALAPGLAFRWVPWDSPFSLNMFAVFRPNLRAWESGLGVPAAHAIQFGLSMSVDVTLFDLYSSYPNLSVPKSNAKSNSAVEQPKKGAQ